MEKGYAYCADDLRLLAIFMQHSHDGIFITDSKGKLLLVNPAIERLLEIGSSKIVGKYVSEIIESGIYEGSPTMSSIETKAAYTGIVKPRNGEEIVSTSKPIFNDSGELELVITNCRPFKPLMDFLGNYYKGSTLSRYRAAPEQTQVGLIHQSGIMRDLLRQADRIAKSNAPVIIYGETGSGKGLLAKYIHAGSPCSTEKMLEVNCAAIPENLIESELFGYEKGAFTGASTTGKLGLFEIADRSTIFLDEIGEIPLPLQPKLLTVLDDGYVRRIGGTISRRTGARVIAATNKNLQALVRCGEFREDLYYRLNILPVKMPPLRDRKEDIALLLEFFLKELNQKYGEDKYFPTESLKLLMDYDWPGNVRQLKNILERSYLLSETRAIAMNLRLIHLDDGIYEKRDLPEQNPGGHDLKTYLHRAERDYIDEVLQQCGGSVSEAAKKLGVHRTALYKKIHQLFGDQAT